MRKWLALIIALPLTAFAAPQAGAVARHERRLCAQRRDNLRDVPAERDDLLLWRSECRQRVTSLPDVGYLRQLNAEGILAMRPTLVLASAQAQPSLALKQVEQSNVNVVTVPGGNAASSCCTVLRRASPCTTRWVACAITRIFSSIALRSLPTSPLNKRVLFILSHGGMNAMAAGQQTAADTAIRAAGLHNAMQGFSRYQPLSQEGVIASQPDLVVISQAGVKTMGGEANLWKLPGLAQTPAGRNKQILQIDDMSLLGFSVRTPHAIQQLRDKAEQLP